MIKYLKKIIFIFFLYLYLIKDFQIIGKKNLNQIENNYTKLFLNLKPKPLNLNHSLIIKEKKDILKSISSHMKKNISFIDNIFFDISCQFGNCLVFLNKFIFYCEIIGCKSIILNKDIFWFIKNKIVLKQSNIIIKAQNKEFLNNYNILNYNSTFFFFNFTIKPEIRINLIADEILVNLPNINVSTDDLFIHIRSGDIFIKPHYLYSQPPLCFYKKILFNFIFKNIYIIASDNKNPIINKLINKYPNIIYHKNNLKTDIALLINAYNIVSSISSFLLSIIQLNNKLKLIFDYNFYQMKVKIRLFHYDLFKYPFKNFSIFRMEPSKEYSKIMLRWKNNLKQRKLMLRDKCKNYFKIYN